FDLATTPSLPSGWTTTASGAQSIWTTTTSLANTSPNSAFSPDPSGIGENALLSPVVNLSSGPSQLSFWHSYELEQSSTAGVGFDGGVLEIDVGGSGFMDILDAGGTFVSGDYNRTISSSFSNPLAGRLAWSGTNVGFTNVIIDLPPSAAGQAVQFKWRCG